MLRRLFILLALVVFAFTAFTTLLSAMLSIAPDFDRFVPMSIAHEKFYVPPLVAGPVSPPPKYFFEAAVKRNKHWIGLHYDRRHYKSELNEGDRERAIRYMLEAWFAFLYEHKLESWIAHGTLLGWYWNGEPLPWDVDVDVQMFVRTMRSMSNRFNATTYQYITAENEVRQYYIDVNPHFLYRSRTNGENVIDARFVDMQNGLYVDITALAETDPIRRPNVISCKNNHRYLVDDILPLRQTIFIGKRAYIPYEFEKVLQKEYSRRALTDGRYMSYIFSVTDQKWLKAPASRNLHRARPGIGKRPTTEPLQRSRPFAPGQVNPNMMRTYAVPGARAQTGRKSSMQSMAQQARPPVHPAEAGSTMQDKVETTNDNVVVSPKAQQPRGLAVGGGRKGPASI
ncbi:LicD family-domain-containing protein [Lipomyces chichibuensis]|uniref:LicD family-domain-containing protein n=1 Tax=Lipomyces chichibuensis TaxID=1546026 RepID=UPI0033431291